MSKRPDPTGTGSVEELTKKIEETNSELSRCSAELARNEQRFRKFVESLPEVVWLSDTHGRTTVMNAAARRLLGIDAQNNSAMRLEDCYSRASYKLLSSKIMQTVELLGSWRGEITLSRREGGDVSVMQSIVGHKNAAGKIEFYSTISTDLTGRKETEARTAWFHSFPEQGPNPIVEFDLASGTVHYANPAATQAFPDIQKQGMKFPGMSALIQSQDGGVANESGAVAGEVQIGERTYRTSSNYIPDTHRLRVYWTDITRCVKAEEACRRSEDALRMSQEQLVNSQKTDAVGQLAAGVAHDFNNQLNIIMGYAALMADHLTDPTMKRYVEHILASTHRSAELSQKLLAYSRKGQFQAVPVSIHKILNDTADMLKRSIDKRIDLKLSLAAQPDSVMGDPVQLQNAILDLAVNASEAMPAGGQLLFETSNYSPDSPRGKTGTSGISSAQPQIRICVSDTGVGMTDDVKRHLFEPFFTTKPVGKGTGMGLPSVFGTVKTHKGTIEVYSEVGHGTTFKVYLPLSDEVAAAHNPAGRPTKKIRKLCILLVDDEEILREMIVDMLSTGVHKILQAENGAQALKIYRDHWAEIDLVILDMIMPEMNGADTFREMKRINPNVKALLSTGFSMNTAVQEILDEGVLGYIQKPFTRRSLIDQVSKVIDADSSTFGPASSH